MKRCQPPRCSYGAPTPTISHHHRPVYLSPPDLPLPPSTTHIRHWTPPAHHHWQRPPTKIARIQWNQNGSTNMVFLFDFEMSRIFGCFCFCFFLWVPNYVFCSNFVEWCFLCFGFSFLCLRALMKIVIISLIFDCWLRMSIFLERFSWLIFCYPLKNFQGLLLTNLVSSKASYHFDELKWTHACCSLSFYCNTYYRTPIDVVWCFFFFFFFFFLSLFIFFKLVLGFSNGIFPSLFFGAVFFFKKKKIGCSLSCGKKSVIGWFSSIDFNGKKLWLLILHL